MTALPPPKQGVAGLRALNDDNDPLGDELRDSWRDGGASSVAVGTVPAAAGCTPDPALEFADTATKSALAYAELMPITKALGASGTWHLEGGGTTYGATITVPDGKAQEDAVERLRQQTWRSPAGIAGQRDWIAIYFAKLAGLSTASHARVLDLLDIALGVTMIPTFRMKELINIRRPWQIDPRVRPRIARLWHSSFPSGHATGAYLCATLLIRLLGPSVADKAKLLALAALVAQNREVANVHTDLDSDAGKTLGKAMGDWLNDAASARCAEFPVWSSLYEYARREL